MQHSKKPFASILTGLVLMCLILSLVGCAGTPRIVVLTPPDTLLADCPVPDYPVLTNGDLARLALDRADALDRCNADKSGLREWAENARNGAATPRSEGR